jgi:hypothetical protein
MQIKEKNMDEVKKQELADKNQHIPTEEIKQDILDTEHEVVAMKRQIEGLNLIGDKLSLFYARAKESGVKEREDFIASLKIILEAREAK